MISDRVRPALDHVDKLVLSSDCRLKHLSRVSAAAKMRALAGATALLRSEL
jgi:5-methyltetrahydropteroyltriglutamate--homocysteine methyltransferase